MINEANTHEISRTHGGTVRPYLRVGMAQEGTKRRRWFWAIKTRGGKTVSYLELTREGETCHPAAKGSDAEYETRFTVGFAHEFVEKPAGVSLKYGWLEILK